MGVLVWRRCCLLVLLVLLTMGGGINGISTEDPMVTNLSTSTQKTTVGLPAQQTTATWSADESSSPFNFTTMVFQSNSTQTSVSQEDVTSMSPDSGDTSDILLEYPSHDGWYNNRANPSWGAPDTPLQRKAAARYHDGCYEPPDQGLPNPLEVSDMLFNGSTGLKSLRNATVLLAFFGQQVMHEIIDLSTPGCPPEHYNIEVPKGHPIYDPDGEGDKEMPFRRSRYEDTSGDSPNNPRKQINEISAWLDGGIVYGPNWVWTNSMRSGEDGFLASNNGFYSIQDSYPALNDHKLPMFNPPPPTDHKLKHVERFMQLGDKHGNEDPYILALDILWFRYHNLKAKQLKSLHPIWDDEKLFQEARKWTIATYQKVVMYEWLPAWLGENLEPYEGYETEVNPAVSDVFHAAAVGFGWTMIPPGVFRRDSECNFLKTTDVTGAANKDAVRLCNTYWDPEKTLQESDGIDQILMGMASQIAEREDMTITPDLRGYFYGHLDFSRKDLVAMTLQRSRDHGMTDYNTMRRIFRLDPVRDWSDINPARANDTEFQGIIDRLRQLYNDDIESLEVWPAGMLETTEQGLPGPLFTAIIKDQFQRIRDGDRFWYENWEHNGLFTEEEVTQIDNTTFWDVIIDTTNIPNDSLQQNVFFWLAAEMDASFEDSCRQPFQLTSDVLEQCTPLETYDYFDGSRWSFALSLAALGIILLLCIGLLICLARRHDQEVEKQRSGDEQTHSTDGLITATEWVGKKHGNRHVFVKLDASKKSIFLKSKNKKSLRTLDLTQLCSESSTDVKCEIVLSNERKGQMLVLTVPKEYDLILLFENEPHRRATFMQLKEFFEELGIPFDNVKSARGKDIRANSITKEVRQRQLEKFFKAIFSHVFKLGVGDDVDLEHINRKEGFDVLNCELTKMEFAEALALKPNSSFVKSMFALVDKDNSGYISFREFLDMMVIFHEGSAGDKAKLLFDMYDIDNSGTLTKEEFRMMLRSLMEINQADVEKDNINDLVENLFTQSGFDKKEEVTVTEFMEMLKDYSKELGHSSISVEGARASVKKTQKGTKSRALDAFSDYSKNEPSPKDQYDGSMKTLQSTYPQTKIAKKLNEVTKFFENYRMHIFWVSLFTLVCIGCFIQKVYQYSFLKEGSGMRRVCGYGLPITRGAASSLMFAYSCLLLTMCRNMITFLRETFLHRFIPFDAAIPMHKYIAFVALFFTVVHCVGHVINFYHVSTQTAYDIQCLLSSFVVNSDDLPKFHHWLWTTITGVTAVLATAQVFLIYIFAVEYARRHAFRWFWATHRMFVILFFLMIIHGCGRLVQAPSFHYYLLVPALLFTFDKLISVSRKKAEIAVLNAEMLPSDVTYLEFKKPKGFDYKSGQWVRIACLEQGPDEYHPFTLASAPHEDNLCLYIRAVGPWTWNLRTTYDPTIVDPYSLPKIYLDGPYGEGHQDWSRYDVSVLVGGGIGVTPFASILKDIAFGSMVGKKFQCKKVYFLWVTRTPKQFEWMMDVIREVEELDQNRFVSVHIFITQFKQNFDISTTMLYICESHFQKISNRSLFTGLRSTTHFGRPDFSSFLKKLVQDHDDTSIFGVFSCGPAPMCRGIEKACADFNKHSVNVLFNHHWEIF